MRIVEITYSEGKTVQEEAYSPRSFHLSAKMELGEGESPESYYEILRDMVHKELQNSLPKLPVDITKTDSVPF